jgi:hypothetical protein
MFSVFAGLLFPQACDGVRRNRHEPAVPRGWSFFPAPSNHGSQPQKKNFRQHGASSSMRSDRRMTAEKVMMTKVASAIVILRILDHRVRKKKPPPHGCFVAVMTMA